MTTSSRMMNPLLCSRTPARRSVASPCLRKTHTDTHTCFASFRIEQLRERYMIADSPSIPDEACKMGSARRTHVPHAGRCPRMAALNDGPHPPHPVPSVAGRRTRRAFDTIAEDAPANPDRAPQIQDGEVREWLNRAARPARISSKPLWPRPGRHSALSRAARRKREAASPMYSVDLSAEGTPFGED